MATTRWSEIIVEAEPEAADAVGHILLEAGCNGFEVRLDSEPPTLVGYLPIDDRLEGRLEQIQSSLIKLPEFGVAGAGTELTLHTVQEEDWANAWKEFFKPIRVGKNFIVTPPWEAPDLLPTDIPIIVDPGMAFGTGSHPTTQLCLAALEDYLVPGMAVADIGTGSGILAIAASKLGAKSVIANDIEPNAVQIAAENAAINSVEIQTQLEMPHGTYDLVVANILADVIIALANNIVQIVKPGGLFIASGIIETRITDVLTKVEAAGFRIRETRTSDDWAVLIFTRIKT